MKELKTYRFDCKGNNAPAYGCNIHGDNSGLYYSKEDVDRLLEEMSQKIDKKVAIAIDEDHRLANKIDKLRQEEVTISMIDRWNKSIHSYQQALTRTSTLYEIKGMLGI